MWWPGVLIRQLAGRAAARNRGRRHARMTALGHGTPSDAPETGRHEEALDARLGGNEAAPGASCRVYG
jgi:hypothetical protein